MTDADWGSPYCSEREVKDPVVAVLCAVRPLLTRADADTVLLSIERRVRQQYGGMASYLGRKTPRDVVANLVRIELKAGKSQRVVAQVFDLSIRTVQRMASECP